MISNRLFVLPLLILSGCATYATAVLPGPYKVGKSYTIELDQTWAKLDQGAPQGLAATVFTLDGPALNSIYLVDGLEPGKPLLKANDKIKTTPLFRSDMSPSELAEFIADTLSALDYKTVETHGLRPQAFATAAGIRFDITAANASGLLIAGMAQVAIVNGRLDAIIYMAPQEYYHDLRQRDAERIMATVNLM